MANEIWITRQEAELVIDLLEDNFRKAGDDAGIGADFAMDLREKFGMGEPIDLEYGSLREKI